MSLRPYACSASASTGRAGQSRSSSSGAFGPVRGAASSPGSPARGRPLRQPREPRALRRQVDERDRPAPDWEQHVVLEIALHGIVERHQALLRHLCEQRRREDLCDRADLEDRVGGGWLRPIGADAAEAHGPALPVHADADHDARMLARPPTGDVSDRTRVHRRLASRGCHGRSRGHHAGTERR
jgi:hypothetical protein